MGIFGIVVEEKRVSRQKICVRRKFFVQNAKERIIVTMNEAEIKALQKQYAEQIGERLRIMRESAGYTQEELGWYVAKGYSTISRYECGTAPLPASDIPILTTRCNRSPSYLFQFEETITEECKAVQEAIRKSYEMMKMLDMKTPDISGPSYMTPFRGTSGIGALSQTAIKRASDMGTAFYMHSMDYITGEELQKHIIEIQRFDYSKEESYFEKF